MLLEDLLEKHFSYTSFRPGQKEVIEEILNGRDVVALLPTGMGKSLCYQLPGYVFDKPVLIVSPLLSLMQDQVEQLKRFGEKRVIALNSFLSVEDKRYALHYLDQYRFIFTSPEMLLQDQVQERLKRMDLSLIVVDEAHCISQWGFDFRPDYLRIGEWFQEEMRPPVLALTATATDKVLLDIRQYLHMENPFEYIHAVDRSNIHLGRLFFRDKDEKLGWIVKHVQETTGPGIIYTQSRVKTENYSKILIEHGIRAAAYHAGMDQADRQFVQQQFIDGQLEWIVATNAFGMGIHKSDIRQVLHDSLPATIANYMQEIGRAGRDGEDALAILLYAERDEEFSKFIVTDDLPRDHHVDVYGDIVSQGQSPSQMITLGEIGETAFRVLDFWMQQLPTAEVKSRLEELRIGKYRAVDEMMKIVQGETCMREQVVAHFGQNLEKRPHNCCQYCGIDYREIVSNRQPTEVVETDENWQTRLARLLV